MVGDCEPVQWQETEVSDVLIKQPPQRDGSTIIYVRETMSVSKL